MIKAMCSFENKVLDLKGNLGHMLDSMGENFSMKEF